MIQNKRVVGSIIARLGSKRLMYKNLLPFGSKTMLGLGIEKLQACPMVDEVIVSTESELIARVAHACGARVLRRPTELAADDVVSVPVFQHILQNCDADIHVNLNINFPLCEQSVIEHALELVVQHGEVLSVPHAVWAQTREVLMRYGDPKKITAKLFDDARAGVIDVHTEQELLEVHKMAQKDFNF